MSKIAEKAMTMPLGSAILEEEELMYMEGGYIVATKYISASDCLYLYNKASKYSIFNDFANGVAGTVAGGALCYALGIAAAPATMGISLVASLASTLLGYFGWYGTMVRSLYNCRNTGAKVTYFSNGEVYVLPR